MFRIKSTIPGAVWPAVPASGGAAILAALFQLEHSQWWKPAQHWARQREQLRLLLRHAADTCPYYANSLPAAVSTLPQDFSEQQFRKLPILRRVDIQNNYDAIVSGNPPGGHGRPQGGVSSGSTGEPIRFLTTQLSTFFWQAINLRDHLWHRRDFGLKLATIRAGAERVEMRNWFGDVGETTLETGPCIQIPMHSSTREQAREAITEDPAYLTGYPNNLAGVLEQVDRLGGKLPGLRQVRSFGEAVKPEFRNYVKLRWNVPLIDLYSTREAGYLALQCPDTEDYHLQSEVAYIEVLDELDRPCRPGETGRVVVTPLHNFAFPLIRYELGDYAEVGAVCSCGRGLPVIRRILGRSRNLMKLRDGRTFWPVFGVSGFLEIVPIRQFQFVQRSYDELELKLVTGRELTGEERVRFGEYILENLGYRFRLVWTFLPEIPQDPGGKFEDFICAFDD